MVTINADHSGMVKFSDREDPGYQRVRGEINRHATRVSQQESESDVPGTSVSHHGNNYDNAKAFYGGTFSGGNTFN